MAEDFDSVYLEYRPQMVRWAAGRVPGLTRDEVYSELTVVLWKAWSSYDGTGDFRKYFMVCWLRKKSDLVEAFFAIKRRSEVLMDHDGLLELQASYGFDITDCPVTDPVAQRVWGLLAAGFLFMEVQEVLGLTRKRFDRVLTTLRTDPAVLAALGH